MSDDYACWNCDGTGHHPHDEGRLCQACGGSGIADDPNDDDDGVTTDAAPVERPAGEEDAKLPADATHKPWCKKVRCAAGDEDGEVHIAVCVQRCTCERRARLTSRGATESAPFKLPVRMRWDEAEEEWDLVDGDNLLLLSLKEWRYEHDVEASLGFIARAINAYGRDTKEGE